MAYERLGEAGLPLRHQEESWERLVEYRGSYASALESLIAYLAAPRGFWGHSAGDVLTEPQTQPVDRKST